MRWISTLLLFLLLAPPMAEAGQDPSAEQSQSETHADEVEPASGNNEDQVEATEASDPPAKDQEQDILKRLEVIEGEVTQLREENQQLRDEMELSEIEDYEDETVKSLFQKTLTIYGFFDLSFIRFFSDDSAFHNLHPAHSSFVLSNVNIYFYSELTNNLSSMIELKFSFAPHGQETALEMSQFGMDYERVDTSVGHPYTNQQYQWGGVTIERAHLTWERWEFFAVTAGRFLTPFGIWNIDHGSPVLIGVMYPHIQLEPIVPLAQTGLQIHGKVFPSDTSIIEYAFTLSNGRGPLESFLDLDEDKGLGLRLRYLYEGDELTLAVGGYGYMGDYTDIKKIMHSTSPLDVEEVVTTKLREYAVTADLLLEFYGVRFQSEFGRAMTLYKNDLRPRVLGGYAADFTETSCYGLLAYTLPLSPWIGDVLITPYITYQYRRANDTYPDLSTQLFGVGLNFKPSPYVVLKAEYIYVESKRALYDWSMVSAQMAVSF